MSRSLRNAIPCLLLLVAGSASANTIRNAFAFFETANYIRKVPGLFSNYDKCLARGFSPELCHSAMSYCAFNDLPLPGIAGAFSSFFSLNDVFKADCGNGECYACCYVPGSYSRCHSAFYSELELPVINCNRHYGAGTKQIAHTLVVDPDAKPGQACLFTPQTCDHLAICVRNRSDAEIDALNEAAEELMRSAPAVRARARDFGNGVMADWERYLANFHTSADEPSNAMRDRVDTFSELATFVTGRGCAGWRRQFPESFPTDWSEPQFRIADRNGVYAEEASHYNALRQLGTVRLIGSVPNLYERLAEAESRVWSASAIQNELAPIGDADRAFLRMMSPVALDLLQSSNLLQDYRLLAVPLPGEAPQERWFNGCRLGDPPLLRIVASKRGTLGITVSVDAADSAASASQPVEVLLLWGDGSVSRIDVPRGRPLQTVSHDYAAGGRYQVLAIAQNDAGLRTIAATVVQTAGSGVDRANTPLPIVSEIQLVDLRATIDASSGNTMSLLFEMEGWLSPTAGYVLGISRALPVPHDTVVRFGTIAGWNSSADPLRSVTIRPSRFGEGVLYNLKRTYFTLDRMRLGVYSTEDNKLRYVEVPVTAEMVRLYPADGSAPVPLLNPMYDAAGRLEIPVQVERTRYARIDLLFPSSALAAAVQGPVTNATWVGSTETLQEVIPDDGPKLLQLRQRAVRR